MMKTIGNFILGTARYLLRQVCAVLVSAIILVGTVLGAVFTAFLVGVLGIVFAMLVLIAPILGLSERVMVKNVKEHVHKTADNLYQFSKS